MVLKDLIEEVSLEDLTSTINRIYNVKWHITSVKPVCDYLHSGFEYFDDFSEGELEDWLDSSTITITRNPNNKGQIGALQCSHRYSMELIYNRIILEDDIDITDDEILAHIIFAYCLNSESLFDTLSEIEEPYFSEKYVENKISYLDILASLKKYFGEPDWILDRVLKILKDDKISLGRKKQLYEFYHPIELFLSKWENVKDNTDLNISKKDFYNFYKTGIKEINYSSFDSLSSYNLIDYITNLIENYEDRNFNADYSESIVFIWIGKESKLVKSDILQLRPVLKDTFPKPKFGIGEENGANLRIEVLLKK